MKKPDSMYSSTSFTDLTVFRSGKTDEAGRELVVTCGYTNGGQYGYFICYEDHGVDKKSNKPVWLYVNQYSFDQKKTEATYREVLRKLRGLVS